MRMGTTKTPKTRRESKEVEKIPWGVPVSVKTMAMLAVLEGAAGAQGGTMLDAGVRRNAWGYNSIDRTPEEEESQRIFKVKYQQE